MAKIEFYIGRAEGYIAVVDDGAVPSVGETVNILKTDYYVSRVAWGVDNAGQPFDAKLRAAVELIVKPI